jgi:hypothetical protein
MNRLVGQGTWVAWGIGTPADLFDGYMCIYISVDDEDLISVIREQDPEWSPPNDDVEDLNDLNDSWAIEVSGITDQEVHEQVSTYPDEIRGVIRIKLARPPLTRPDVQSGRSAPIRNQDLLPVVTACLRLR